MSESAPLGKWIYIGRWVQPVDDMGKPWQILSMQAATNFAAVIINGDYIVPFGKYQEFLDRLIPDND